MRPRPADAGATSRGRRPAVALGLAGAFVGLGFSGSLPPALLPVLTGRSGLPAATASLVISAVFAGLFLGVLVAAVGGARRPPAQVLTAGAALQAAGLLLLAHGAARAEIVVGAVVLGTGFGMTELSATAIVRGLERVTGRGLTRLTSLVALTAAVTPVVLALLVSAGHWRALFVCAALVQLLGAGGVLAAGGLAPDVPRAPWRAAVRPRRSHLAVAGYVGAETLVVAWVARIAGSTLHLGLTGAVGATAAFWIAIATGRQLAGVLLTAGLPARRLLVIVLSVAGAAFAVAAAVGGVPRAVVLLVGLLSAGPVYPLLVSTAPDSTDPRTLATLIAVGAFGGSVVTLGGTLAFRTAGLAGVLLLAGALLGVSLAASCAPRPGRV